MTHGVDETGGLAADAARWVELRIHGVSGTPPESMLECGRVLQVAGDSWGRFFRPVNSVNEELQTGDRVLEGYHWGRFTSGNWRQGLWLVLIPFGFVNAAAFMVPHPPPGRLKYLHTVVVALIRGVGIGLTSTFALATALILVDLLAWQAADHLPWLENVPDGWVMTAGLWAAGLVLFLLHWLSRENRTPIVLDDPPAGCIAADMGAVGLGRSSFFSGNPDAPILNRLHLAGAWAVVALIGVLTWRRIAASVTGSDESEAQLQGVLWWPTLLLLGVISAIVVCLGDPEQSLTGTEMHAWWHEAVLPWLTWLLLAIAAAALAGSGILLLQTNKSPIDLNYDQYSRFLPAAMAGTMIVLLLANAALAWSTRDSMHAVPAPFRRYAWGLAPWATASTGLFLGVGFSGAFVLAVAQIVNAEAEFDLINRIAYTWGLTVLLLVVMAVVMLLRVLDARLVLPWEVAKGFAVRYGSRTSRSPIAELLPRIATARGVARLKFCMPRLFLTWASVGLLMTIVTVYEMFGISLWWWLSKLELLSSGSDTRAWSVAMINLGTYALIALATLLFFLGRRALRTVQARRGINVVWDVVSFWPHSAHPFVPPAYSQFAVRDLLRRIRFHLGQLSAKPKPVAESIVVSAHSQGSLLAFATLLWLTPEELSRVGVVTYGSQLQVAFPRAFPAYVNFELLNRVHAKLDRRWVNLYRETDPIAGPVLSWNRSHLDPGPATSQKIGSDVLEDKLRSHTGRRESGYDWRVLDPAPPDIDVQVKPLLQLFRHSHYPLTKDYQVAVDTVRP